MWSALVAKKCDIYAIDLRVFEESKYVDSELHTFKAVLLIVKL